MHFQLLVVHLQIKEVIGTMFAPNGQRPAEQNDNITEDMGFPDTKE
jgi:hypothetical protein